MSTGLWGIFFEEINFAGDGGIYAELIRSRAFEDSGNPLAGWVASCYQGARIGPAQGCRR